MTPLPFRIARTTAAVILAAATIATVSAAAQAGGPERRVPPADTSDVSTVALQAMSATGFQPFTDFAAPTVEAGEHVLGQFGPAHPSPPAGEHSMAARDTRSAHGHGAGHQASTTIKAGPGCSVQCITGGVAYARGVGAKLVVDTDTPARIRIQVWNDDYFRIFDSPEDDVKSFAATFDDLEAGTYYSAAAYAWDGQGYMSIADGSFETLTRNVEVTFSHATIIASPYGSDRYAMDVWVDGAWEEGLAAQPLYPDGANLPLNINIVDFEDVDRDFDFAIMLEQFDTGDHICEVWPRPDEPIVAQAECYTWAYATFADGMDDLDARPAGADSWTEHTLNRTLAHPYGGALPPGYGYPLNFTVEVALHVTYN